MLLARLCRGEADWEDCTKQENVEKSTQNCTRHTSSKHNIS